MEAVLVERQGKILCISPISHKISSNIIGQQKNDFNNQISFRVAAHYLCCYLIESKF